MVPLPDALDALDAVDLAGLRRRHSAKWTAYPADVIPAWVAEMDFPLAQPIRERLIERLDAGDLGYPSAERSGVREALRDWLQRSYGWAPETDSIVVLPDTVRGIDLAVLAHTGAGDAVAVPTPVYPPFLSVVRENGRRLIEVELARRAGGDFALDFDALERALANGARMVLLCHPHNPTGHLNDPADLAALAELAVAAGATVVSDEIHAPLTLDGAAHTPFATVSAAAASCAVTVTSASKAWNIPGLKTAFLIAEDAAMMAPFRELDPRVRHGCSILGLEASIAAYGAGGPWLEAVLATLSRNRDMVVEAVAGLPGVALAPPRATYLAWLDCHDLALPEGPYEFFLERARVALSDGAHFGAGGDGHVRLNFATARGILAEILERIADAVHERAAE